MSAEPCAVPLPSHGWILPVGLICPGCFGHFLHDEFAMPRDVLDELDPVEIHRQCPDCGHRFVAVTSDFLDED
ncbi:MAG: hypothetical protein ACJ8C4_09945 [Gemmataceae bacterium]